MKKLHVLVIPSWYPNSYNELSGIFFKEQAEALAKQELKVGVIALSEIGLKQIFLKKKLDFFYKPLQMKGVEGCQLQYPVVPKLYSIRRKVRLYIFKKIFNRYCKEHGVPDIVHLHSFLYGDLVLYLKDKYKIPYIVTEHSSGFKRNLYTRNILNYAKSVYGSSDYNIAVSYELKKYLENKFETSFSYIPNGVDTTFFSPLSLDKNTDKFRFINVAFLEKNKNQQLLIEAFYRVFNKERSVELMIVGDGPEYANLKKLIKKMGLGKQVVLYGRATRSEIKTLLEQSNVFVLSSKYETFGVVLIEAMAMGLPVVATKCGGPESIVVSDKVGYLCDIDEQEFASKMKKIYNNYKQFDKKYIRNYVEENFSEMAIGKVLLKVYESIVK